MFFFLNKKWLKIQQRKVWNFLVVFYSFFILQIFFWAPCDTNMFYHISIFPFKISQFIILIVRMNLKWISWPISSIEVNYVYLQLWSVCETFSIPPTSNLGPKPRVDWNHIMKKCVYIHDSPCNHLISNIEIWNNTFLGRSGW